MIPKFRVWDKKGLIEGLFKCDEPDFNEEDLTPCYLINSKEIFINQDFTRLSFLAEGMGCEFDINDFDIEQFTGLTDCKGKEIYEGDILFNPDIFKGHKTRVIYDQGCFSIVPINFSGGEPRLSVKYGGEVIGNIHENPELLSEEE